MFSITQPILKYVCPPAFAKDDWAPLKFTLKPAAVHWEEDVKHQLARDVELGILEKVPLNTPTVWCHRIVVVRKQNGSPRRTVNM